MKLYDHQAKSLLQTKDRNRVAYFLDMGLGKTYVGSEKMRELHNRVNLIICQKSKVNDWVQHYADHYEWMEIHDLTKKGGIEKFKESRFNTIVGVINYELAWRRKDLLTIHDFTLMLDESSLIQNKQAKQSKFILKLDPVNVILLSGTPTAGKYENLWTQLHLMGWTISEDLYNSQYVNWVKLDVQGFIHKIVDKEDPYKNVDRLKLKLREHGAVFLKTEDCFDLPEQTFIELNVPRSKEYKRFMKHHIVTVQTFDGERELVGDATLTKRIYARQLCGSYSKEKQEAFKDLLESTNERVIVFYNFNDEVRALIDIALELERPVSVVNGAVKNLDHYENDANSVTFIQYQAGAMGLNLQKANKIIYYSLPERSELFEQSKKRIHRIGQTNHCFYYILKCENTIEQAIHDTLKMRKDFTDELFIESVQDHD